MHIEVQSSAPILQLINAFITSHVKLMCGMGSSYLSGEFPLIPEIYYQH